MKNVPRIKIVRVATIPDAFVHILPTLKFLVEQNFEVHLISSPGDYWTKIKNEIETVHVKEIVIAREISPLKDFVSLIKIFIFLIRIKPQVIHSSTPKAGLITAVAAFFARIPVRNHTFTGQRWATMEGVKKSFLIFLDKVIVKLNTKSFADSPSQVKFLLDHGVHPIGCLHKGSYGGIDLLRFGPHIKARFRKDKRDELKIPKEAIVGLFLGRITIDKGIRELINAFLLVAQQNARAYLVIVGPWELGADSSLLERIESCERVRLILGMQDPIPFYSIADYFVLPSYREGFGTVALEAQACSLPVIGTKIPGLIDAVDERFGLLIPPKDTQALLKAMLEVVNNYDKYEGLGILAAKHVAESFDCKILASVQKTEYSNQLYL